MLRKQYCADESLFFTTLRPRSIVHLPFPLNLYCRKQRNTVTEAFPISLSLLTKDHMQFQKAWKIDNFCRISCIDAANTKCYNKLICDTLISLKFQLQLCTFYTAFYLKNISITMSKRPNV